MNRNWAVELKMLNQQNLKKTTTDTQPLHKESSKQQFYSPLFHTPYHPATIIPQENRYQLHKSNHSIPTKMEYQWTFPWAVVYVPHTH